MRRSFSSPVLPLVSWPGVCEWRALHFLICEEPGRGLGVSDLILRLYDPVSFSPPEFLAFLFSSFRAGEQILIRHPSDKLQRLFCVEPP